MEGKPVLPEFWFAHPEQQNALQELRGLSDRAAGIVGAAFLEDKLTAVIQKQFIDDETHKSVIDSLLKDPNGPLATFGTKVNIAFAFGLLSQQGHKDLKTISRIRNHFAHAVTAVSFYDVPIKEYCANLKALDDLLDKKEYSFRLSDDRKTMTMATYYRAELINPRHRFIWAINAYSFQLILALTFESLGKPYF
jgi:DNA-binding MltR family transcriptional regulator